MNANLHRLAHHHFDFRLALLFLEGDLAHLHFHARLGQRVLHRLGDALLDLLGGLLLSRRAQGLHQLAFERHVHEAGQERHGRRLVLRRERLDRLGHGIELLASIAGRAWDILQRHHQARALQIVGQVGVAVLWVHLGLVDDHRAVFCHGIALNHHGVRLVAQILHDHRQQQLSHHGACRAEVAHHQPQ